MITRIFKGIKSCPCCGGKAMFTNADAMSYHIVCTECGLSSKSVLLPSYWSKGGRRMISRLFMRVLEPWNKRNPYGRVDVEEVNRVLDNLKNGGRKLP